MQEVLRKIQKNSVGKGHLVLEKAEKYVARSMNEN